jgi:hypothetical protein
MCYVHTEQRNEHWRQSPSHSQNGTPLEIKRGNESFTGGILEAEDLSRDVDDLKSRVSE